MYDHIIHKILTFVDDLQVKFRIVPSTFEYFLGPDTNELFTNVF